MVSAICLILALFTSAAHAQKTASEQASIDIFYSMKAKAQTDQLSQFEKEVLNAKESGKILILPLTATWCGYCPSLVAELTEALQKDTKLAARYQLHPIVAQTHEVIDGKTKYHDNESGMKVIHQILDPIVKDSGISMMDIITGWPTLVMLDPSSPEGLRIVQTGLFQVPQSEWKPQRYHDGQKTAEFLKTFSFTARSCRSIFGG